MSQEELEESIGFEIGDKCLLVTYHPVTLENSSAEEQSKNLLAALDQYKDYRIIFTMPNSDTNGRIIMREIEKYVEQNKERSIAFKSLGLKRYLSALQYVTAVVGNSSSGIIEVPSFGIPTLNIGDRQKGRIAASSVVHCGTTYDEIGQGLREILSESPIMLSKNSLNPYEKSNTISAILSVIRDYPINNLIQKSFYNL
jgi:UDP-N-acetylglucosamine 2-epimerase (non-hydrolysing)/GDP/UDP-N,N'-diacetylbacillosamine 2-epimerase (hydrolysing)